ncbi:MAG: hypothetical protein LPL29_07615 [Alphaproteobacteria bacterium]|nr:hypothetical protein [Alphaproteobacteria bacterium]
MERIALSLGIATGAVFGISVFAAWLTHVITSLGLVIENESWVYLGILVAGAFIPPLGVIHGVMIWFGAGL